MDLFRGQQLLKANGSKIAAEYALKAKQYILVYFAHAASGGFTQVLREFYEVSSQKNIVKVSCELRSKENNGKSCHLTIFDRERFSRTVL